jgi:hypothetical protein
VKRLIVEYDKEKSIVVDKIIFLYSFSDRRRIGHVF